jgi:NAD(P)-dependent dehydrogenase (short-subunit alcohol dehydrogenase family)/SAM-dependent methyltransferase
LAKECAQWKVRLVDLPLAQAGETSLPVEEILRLPADTHGDTWVYRAGEWYRQQFVCCEFGSVGEPPLRERGVYVVIGGAGGLGQVFSEFLVRNYQAQLVWIGRRALDASIQASIDRLARWGPAPLYVCADATDRVALTQARQQIVARYHKVHGLVHATIVLADKSVALMEEERFRSSLAAKVDVSVRLAQVFSSENLDFVLFFSSLQSSLRAAGQSNYAAGCTFKDAFAARLFREWGCPAKVMNWGYWGSVGVVASEPYRARLARLGIGSIEPQEGMAALLKLLAGPESQLSVVKTNGTRLPPALNVAHERLTLAKEQGPSVIASISRCSERALDPESKGIPPADAQHELQSLLAPLLLAQLQSVGLFSATGHASVRGAPWCAMLPRYERWLEESSRILREEGYLGQGWTQTERGRIESARSWREWDERRHAWELDADLRAQVRLVDATVRALPDILSGRRLPTDVLFPNSSMEMVEGVYKHNRIADYFNSVLADAVIEYVEARCRHESDGRLRILEIGAGTGGTSATLFARLEPYERSIAEYCYTDLSKAFLLHAAESYGPSVPYLARRTFDVERSLQSQGMTLGSYDIVVATNVLHATKSIRRTLRNAKAALKRHGLLVLNEMNGRSLFLHLTFGLLEGWWSYDDEAVRIRGTPALASDTWERLLVEAGFHAVVLPAGAAHRYGQQIVVAESDGVIRQPLEVLSGE